MRDNFLFIFKLLGGSVNAGDIELLVHVKWLTVHGRMSVALLKVHHSFFQSSIIVGNCQMTVTVMTMSLTIHVIGHKINNGSDM